jgi:hypothetical protein
MYSHSLPSGRFVTAWALLDGRTLYVTSGYAQTMQAVPAD